MLLKVEIARPLSGKRTLLTTTREQRTSLIRGFEIFDENIQFSSCDAIF
jgi:hypothetical protein